MNELTPGSISLAQKVFKVVEVLRSKSNNLLSLDIKIKLSCTGCDDIDVIGVLLDFKSDNRIVCKSELVLNL